MADKLPWSLLNPRALSEADMGKAFRGVAWGQFLIGIIGFGVSLWALVLHVQIKTGSAGSLVCDINETINCTKIIGSDYGELYGIPLGSLGMSYWSIALVFAFLGKILRASPRYIRAWQLFVGAVGGVSALALAYVAYIVIQGVCEVCAVVQVSCLIYFVLTLVSFLRTRNGEVFAEKRSFLRLTMATTLAGLIPLTSAWAASAVVAKATGIPAATFNSSGNKFSGQTSAGDWFKGSATAKVEIMEFTDFECPYCQALHERLKEVHESIGKGNLRIVFRNWPLSYHKYSAALAIAARCAGRQGHFWDFADWAFENSRIQARDETKKSALFSRDGLLKKAESLGLNREEFGVCLSGKSEAEKLAADAAEAQKLGGNGTPFVLLNGKPYEGNWMNGDALESAIRDALK